MKTGVQKLQGLSDTGKITVVSITRGQPRQQNRPPIPCEPCSSLTPSCSQPRCETPISSSLCTPSTSQYLSIPTTTTHHWGCSHLQGFSPGQEQESQNEQTEKQGEKKRQCSQAARAGHTHHGMLVLRGISAYTWVHSPGECPVTQHHPRK